MAVHYRINGLQITRSATVTAMTTIKSLYCSHCRHRITPIRTLINYQCPDCGATFLAKQVEQVRDDRTSIQRGSGSKPGADAVI